MNDIKFGTLNRDGSLPNVTTLKAKSIKGCPHFIFDPKHYSADGSCRCNDVTHKEMKEWGYKWNKKTQVWE